MKRKSKKKKRSWKGLFFLILVGIGASMAFFFRQEIYNAIRPWLEERGVLGEKREVILYFSDPEGEYLIGEIRKILKREDDEEEAEETLIELIKGPKGNLIPTLPSRTKVLALDLDEKGVAKVNFNLALIRDHPGGSSAEMLTVYSVVNSLTLNFPEIKRIQFLVEGKQIETIAGHLSLKQPIPSKPDLIKRQ
jgi:spore germination protein GerM